MDKVRYWSSRIFKLLGLLGLQPPFRPLSNVAHIPDRSVIYEDPSKATSGPYNDENQSWLDLATAWKLSGGIRADRKHSNETLNQRLPFVGAAPATGRVFRLLQSCAHHRSSSLGSTAQPRNPNTTLAPWTDHWLVSCRQETSSSTSVGRRPVQGHCRLASTDELPALYSTTVRCLRPRL